MSTKAITIIFHTQGEKRCEECGCHMLVDDCLICYADKQNRRTNDGETNNGKTCVPGQRSGLVWFKKQNILSKTRLLD